MSSDASSLHPTAIIHPKAELDAGVIVEAYAFIGPEVKVGKGSIIQHHATVDGFTELGTNNSISPYAFIGGKTHDLKFKGGKPGLKIGNNNTFREYSSVHLATNDGEFTTIGDDNVILAYSHVAHDCQIANHIIMSSHAALGGHVYVDNYVNIGWGAGIHQFCNIGTHAMVGACSKVVQDVPPYMTADGSPAEVRTINKIGLERRGFNSEQIQLLRQVFKIIYRSGLNRSQALEKLQTIPEASALIVKETIEFILRSNRGIA